MSTFWRLFTANLKSLVRDKMALFWFLAFPVLFTVLFGFIFSNEGQTSFHVGLASPQGDPLAAGIAAGLKRVEAFKVTAGSLAEELAALRKGDRDIVVEIPEKASAALGAGSGVDIRVHYDAGREQTGRILHAAVSEIVAEAERRISGRPRLLTTSRQPYQTEAHKYIDFLLPGILAMALMQLGLFGAFDVLSLREQKVLKSLGATPLPRPLFLGSEILVRLLLSLVQLGTIVTIGVLIFKVNITGNWLVIAGLVLLGATTFIAMGYMLTSFSRTVESGQGLVQLVQFPMMFLSGIFFPLEIMPKFLEPVVKAMPLTYLADALRQAMVGMAPQYPMGLEMAILGGWLAASLVLAAAMWKWE